MKALKKLIPAAAMLLLCAAMMTTATFAWFNMNNAVSVNSITTNVSAPVNLQISKDNAAWATDLTDVTGSAGVNGINPVTTSDLAKWEATNKADPTTGAAAGSLSTLTLDDNGMCTKADKGTASATPAKDDTADWQVNKYFYTTYTIYIKNVGGEETNVYIDLAENATAITANAATTASDDLLKSITFAATVTGGKTGTAKNQQYIQDDQDSSMAKVTAYETITGKTNNKPMVTLEAQDVVTVKITMWMEGSSKYCNINNVNDKTLKFDFALKFTTVATTPAA